MERRHEIESKKFEEEERKKGKDALERAKTLFVRKDKVIRKNDMITDPAAKKIKLEPERNFNPVVKQDMENGDMFVQSDTMEEGGNGFGTMEADGEVELVRVEEKVDLSDESCVSTEAAPSSFRDVDLAIQTLQKKNEKLQALLNQRNVENGILKTQLEHRNLENKVLVEQRKHAEAQLESETKIKHSLRRQLAEKTAEMALEIGISDGLRSHIAKLEELVEDKQIRQSRLNDVNCSSGPVIIEDAAEDDDLVSSEEKVIQYFQDVLKIFIDWQGKEGDLVNWRKATPTLKICRLVCKSWKQSVDFILEQEGKMELSKISTTNESTSVTVENWKTFGNLVAQKKANESEAKRSKKSKPVQKVDNEFVSSEDPSNKGANHQKKVVDCIEKSRKREMKPRAKCPHCDHVAEKRKLADHIRVVHEKTYNLKCEICGKGERYLCNLRHHKAEVHGICSVKRCNRTIPGGRQGLRNHQLQIHGKEIDIFGCEECGKLFGWLHNFKRHKKCHGSEREGNSEDEG